MALHRGPCGHDCTVQCLLSGCCPEHFYPVLLPHLPYLVLTPNDVLLGEDGLSLSTILALREPAP